MVMCKDSLLNTLKQYRRKYIYGAGVVAYGVYAYLYEVENVNIDAFVVTSNKEERKIADVDVLEFQNVKSGEDVFWIIATPEVYHNEIKVTLEKQGFFTYVCVDYELEYSMMGKYLQTKCNIVLMENVKPSHTFSCEENDCQILMAVSHNDKALAKSYTVSDYVNRIQVGAALTNQRIAELTDCAGINISEQNALYGELTATYYAWKNMRCSIIGLFHYRRILEIEDWMLYEINKRNIDVILPLPFVCYPNTKGQYGRYLTDEDIEIMWDVLKEFSHDYYERSREVLEDRYLYNYNMLVARWEVFEDYCNWMFPILQEICVRCESLNIDRIDRYIGRVGEVLTSIYFLVNKKHWNVGHTRKRWLV